MGGTWERLVRSVKRSLKQSLGSSLLSFIELQTLCAEIEAVLNDRPLTYIQDDEGGISYPLTPAELINGRCITTYNDNHFEILSTNESLTKKANHHKHLLIGFTNRWKSEYLQGLQEVSRNNNRQGIKDVIEIGEVVMVKDEGSPRQLWRLAIVKEVMVSADGIIRSAIVRTTGKDGKTRLLRRALSHLVPLEVKSVIDVEDKGLKREELEEVGDIKFNVDQPAAKENFILKHERRNAACIGEMKRRDGLKLL